MRWTVLLLAPLIPLGFWICWRGLRDSKYDGTWWSVSTYLVMIVGGAALASGVMTTILAVVSGHY